MATKNEGKDVKVDINMNEPSIDILTIVGNFFSNLQKYQHKEPLQDLSVPGLTIKEFWQHDDRLHEI
jgi:hypothetical protein